MTQVAHIATFPCNSKEKSESKNGTLVAHCAKKMAHLLNFISTIHATFCKVVTNVACMVLKCFVYGTEMFRVSYRTRNFFSPPKLVREDQLVELFLVPQT